MARAAKKQEPDISPGGMVVGRKELLEALQLVAKGAGGKPSFATSNLPVYGVCVIGGDGPLKVDATNLVEFASARVDGRVEALRRIAVPIKNLVTVLRSTKGDSVKLGRTDSELSLEIAGRKFKVTEELQNLDSSWPAAPLPRAHYRLIEWDAAEFRSALAFVSRSVCKDETREQLSKVAIIPGLGLVTTDGHRLSIAPVTTLDRMHGFPGRHVDFLLAACKSANTVRLELADSSRADRGPAWRWQIGGAELIQRGSDKDSDCSDYPPVDRIIPSSEPVARAVVDATALREAVSLAAKTSENMDTQGVRLLFSGATLEVRTEQFTEVLELHAPLSEDHELAVNPRYVVDAIPDSVTTMTIDLSGDALGPIHIHADNGMSAVVMPMRV